MCFNYVIYIWKVVERKEFLFFGHPVTSGKWVKILQSYIFIFLHSLPVWGAQLPTFPNTEREEDEISEKVVFIRVGTNWVGRLRSLFQEVCRSKGKTLLTAVVWTSQHGQFETLNISAFLYSFVCKQARKLSGKQNYVFLIF